MDGSEQNSDDKYWYGVASKLIDTNNKLIDLLAKSASHHHDHHHHKHLADGFRLTIFYNGLSITANKMSVQILDTQSVAFVATPTAKGVPSAIFPGSAIVSPSDSTLFTVVLDAVQDPTGKTITGTITGVPAAVGVGALNISANADTTGASVVTITGSDQVGVNAPPPVLADGFSFTYGTPTP